jgi:WD40 repeat protein
LGQNCRFETKDIQGSVNSVAISHDGTRIISGSSDNSIRIWDAQTGGALHELKGHSSSVNSVAISHDGTRIISGSDDNSIRIWDAQTGGALHELKGHSSSVTQLPSRTMALASFPAPMTTPSASGMPRLVGLCTSSKDIQVRSTQLPSRTMALASFQAAHVENI